jgi:uncharacterized protein (DUF1697 family)
MTRYVAFLRAINVGGRVVKMDRLRQLAGALGLANVETFIASGNLVFESAGRTPARLETLVEQGLLEGLRFRVATFVRSLPELDVIAARQPFAGDTGTLYIGFLRHAPAAGAVRQVRALSTGTDRLDVHGREVYWLCRTPMSESTLSYGLMEKLLAGEATFRNSNTVRKIAAKWGGTRHAS